MASDSIELDLAHSHVITELVAASPSQGYWLVCSSVARARACASLAYIIIGLWAGCSLLGGEPKVVGHSSPI